MSSLHKTALITGASSGIGAEYADQLAAKGFNLVLVARREVQLQQHAQRIQTKYGNEVEVIVADLTQAKDLEQISQRIMTIEHLDLVVNCAGVGALGMSLQVDPKFISQMLQLNILALTELSLIAAKRFAQQRSGNIINIGSVLATMPIAGAGAYSGSKAYVLNFSKALQAELKPLGVGVQVIMPGPIKTAFFDDTVSPFPEALFMQAKTLVEISLLGLEKGEDVVLPNLEDISLWEQYEQSRLTLAKALTQPSRVPSRYSSI